MHRIDTETAQADKFGAGKNGFTGGNPQTGRLPTALDEDFFDAVQEEISRVIEGANLTLEKGDYGQLLNALNLLFAPLSGLDNKQDKSDKLTAFSALPGGVDSLAYFTGNNAMGMAALTAAGRSLIGQVSVADMLTYLGIGEGALVPVGVPIPYFASAAPSGWILCNGASFSAASYPKLALAYPTLTLPDLRGEFIRGWDNGRGVDASRDLLSGQGFALQNITGTVLSRAFTQSGGGVIVSATGALSLSAGAGASYTIAANGSTAASTDVTTFDASKVATTSTETRPRNVAFNYIVRAA